MIHLERSALLPQMPEQLLALVQDVGRYPEFVPNCTGASVNHVDADRSHASLQFSMAGLTESFLTENIVHGDADTSFVLDMRLLRGPFKSLSGRWLIRPLGREGCKVSLTVTVDLGAWSLGRLLVPQMERTMSSVMQAFQQRALALHG